MSDQSVVGTVSGIEEKPSGWFEVKVAMPGKQYPLKLATKIEEIVAQARAIGTGVGTFFYNEAESDRINEHTGKPYINRYLNEVVAGAVDGGPESQPDASAGSAATPPAGGSSNDERVERYTPDEVARFEAKERRDYRSRAWAHTMSAFNHTIKTDEDPSAVFDRLKPFHRKIYEDICGAFAYPVDDDIPF